jgi:prophage regulatory protein
MQDASTPTSTDNLLRLEDVMRITSLCRSHVFLLAKKGQFPSSITVGTRGSRWIEREIRAWIQQQIANSRTPNAPISTTVGNGNWSSSL